jgi:hypothetical protein
MDISLGPINTVGLARPAPAPAPIPAPQAAAPVVLPQPAQPEVDASYDAAMKKAAVSFESTYAVSDTKFALYKDASGQLITRYVSLRDGSVTYLPAPTFARQTAPQFAIKA